MGIDPTKWITAYPWGAGTTINHELEYYVDIQDPNSPVPGIDPFGVSGGVLTITAAANAVEGLQYTSGVLTSFTSFSQTYGFFEASLKMPTGAGLWPAFWMEAESFSWPPELDVVEMIGQDPTTLVNTEHDNVDGGDVFRQCFPYFVTPDMSLAFHSYGILWTPTDLTWYFDGDVACHLPTQPSENVPMFLLLNLAVGSCGTWTGCPTSSTPFPQALEVDYVRAYAAPH